MESKCRDRFGSICSTASDAHWQRNPTEFSGPTPELGSGAFNGAQLEAVLSYEFLNGISVGLGGRYWKIGTTGAQAHFESSAVGGGAPQVLSVVTERWGDFCKQIVDLVWEGFRLRRLKVSLIAATAHKWLKEALTPLVGWSEADDLAKAWAARKASALKRVEKILASAHLTMDAVMAQTLSLTLDDFERIERMIAMAESRRHVILHEIDWHRETLSHALRQVVQQVEDGQLRVIENTSGSRGSGK